jgi:tryptophanyl-tRNA synthetase
MEIDPWKSKQIENYERLMREFGIEKFNFDLPEPSILFRRNVVFGHRAFGPVFRAIKRGEKFAVMTGLMPSGKMHLGNKMTIDQVLYYQKFTHRIYIAVADIESYSVRGVSFEQAREVALKEYILNYLALGLNPKEIYFQSKNSRVKDFAFIGGERVNLEEMMNIYGITGSSNMGHIFSPLVQVGDILHLQSRDLEGPLPSVVPVGIDQDPHIRLTRKISRELRDFSVQEEGENINIYVKGTGDPRGYIDMLAKILETKGIGYRRKDSYRAVYVKRGDIDIDDLDLEIARNETGIFPSFAPSSTYHYLMTGLTGGKMSSSVPESGINLTDSPKEVRKKIMNAKTGGRDTEEEQRRLGGRPDICPIFELYRFHFSPDDKDLEEVERTCRNGQRLCGYCKNELYDRISEFLNDLKEKRDEKEHLLSELV